MTLPIDADTIRSATPQEHAAWHSEIHTRLAESPVQPNTIDVNMTGHRAAHQAIAGVVGGGHPTSIAELDPLHLDWHRWIHFFLDTPTTPLVISSGGTYRGLNVGTADTGDPAIDIRTDAQVILEAPMIAHHHMGIESTTFNAVNVEVRNGMWWGRDPAVDDYGHAIYSYQFARWVVEHCRFYNSNCINLAGNNVEASRIWLNNNDFLDMGRWHMPGLDGSIHFDKVLCGDCRMRWNRTVNHFGFSESEDVFGMYQSNGFPGAAFDIAYNLVDGNYPPSGDGAGFTGCCYDLGDSFGTYQHQHHNYAVRYANVAMSSPAGSYLSHDHSKAVGSGLTDTGARCNSTFGGGASLWDNPAYPDTPHHLTMTDCVLAHRRWTGTAWERADWWFPGTVDETNVNNTTISGLGLTVDADWLDAENDLLAEYEAMRATAGQTFGPQRMI